LHSSVTTAFVLGGGIRTEVGIWIGMATQLGSHYFFGTGTRTGTRQPLLELELVLELELELGLELGSHYSSTHVCFFVFFTEI
jgi:hypothetical protein